MPSKDKRALVLFLFGALMLTREIPWPTEELSPNQYALVLGMGGMHPAVRLIGRTPRTEASEPCEWLEPGRPIAANIPARYALFLQQPLPINRADLESLQLLPGVGPHLARAIRQHIDVHGGPLMQPEDLLQVAGIGPKTLERLSPFIRLDQRTQP